MEGIMVPRKEEEEGSRFRDGGSEAIPTNNAHLPFNGLFAAQNTPSDSLTAGFSGLFAAPDTPESLAAGFSGLFAASDTPSGSLTAGTKTQYTTVGYSVSQSNATASEEHWEAKKQTDTTTKTQNTTVNYSVSQSNNTTSEENLETKPKNTLDFQAILSNFIRHQDEETAKNEISDEEEYKLFKLLRDRTKELININRLEEEEIELEFERAVENLDQHRVHCPNCNSCITKVVLCKRRRVDPPIPPSPERDCLFGCLSCFSIFIPRGNCLNLFGCSGKKASEEDSLRATLLPVNSSPNHRDDQQGGCFDLFPFFRKEGPQLKVEKTNTVIDQEDNQRQPPQEQVPTPDTSQNPDEASPGEIKCISREGSESPLTKTPSRKHIGIDIPPISGSNPPGTSQAPEIVPDVSERDDFDETLGSKKVEILKSIVYGGLMESITSLSVVSSAAAADATTATIVAMGLANLIGGLFVLGPNLRELKNDHSGQADRYMELLGQRKNFLLHATVVVLSFLVFGLIPPVTYGFSFRQSDDMDLKLLVVAAASLLCIAILAIGKAYIQKQPNFLTYIKSVLYYVSMAVMGSGISYAAGDLIQRLVKQLGWFDTSAAVALPLPQVGLINPAWGSY